MIFKLELESISLAMTEMPTSSIVGVMVMMQQVVKKLLIKDKPCILKEGKYLEKNTS